ncbi:MAG TPA: family 10 glycosylhydrolase [Candidatus Krumholzibacteria bacterium]|nr:family 10 glycosylhydrolase [Candidatus Krumholzibacteria bacterium]
MIAAIWLGSAVRAPRYEKPLSSRGAFSFAPAPAHADTALFPSPYLASLRESTPILPDDEIRALWVVRDALTSPESVARVVDFAVLTRTHMLFVQVRGRADSFYRSAIEPASPILEAPVADFDPLAYLLTLAHRNGIVVHAWLNVFLVWSDMSKSPPSGHLGARNPDWLLTDAKGVRMDRMPSSRWKRAGVEGWFVSPGNRAMRAHMARVVHELVTEYEIDGIHLDYIRYPNRDLSFDPTTRAEFAVKWGVDPAEAAHGDRGGLQRVIGAGALAVVDSLYNESRVAQVDSMVIAIRAACRDKALSAAVVADPFTARHDKGQDWARWVNNGWMDFVVPMAYNFPPLELEHRATVYNRMVGPERWLMGLGVFDGREEYLAESVELLREVGVMGFSIFSYNVLEKEGFGAALIEEAVLPPDTSYVDEEEDESDE